MKRNFDLVLTDFKLNALANKVPQAILNDYTSWLIASSLCAQTKTTASEKAEQLLQTTRKEFNEYAVSPDIINSRYAMPVAQMLSGPEENVTLPPLYDNLLAQPYGADIAERTHYFQKVVMDFFSSCYSAFSEPPGEIIHTTSMGCIIPTPLQRFLSEHNWTNTTATNAYFFGCFASIPALRLATGSLLNSMHGYLAEKKVLDVIHTEFLTIHIDSLDLSANNIISSTLFSDGFAKYTLHLRQPQDPPLKGLKVIHLQENLIPNTSNDMRWEPGPYQFQLYLSKNIPDIVSKHVADFASSLCKKAGIDLANEKNNLIYAVHPGGSKILDVVQAELELRPQQMQLSRDLLYNSGNMSSATLPYLWNTILNDTSIKTGSKILSLTFGPGMTAAGAILEKI